MVKRIDWTPDAIPSMDRLIATFTDAIEDDASTPVERLAKHHAQMLRIISPDLCFDFASDARLTDDMVPEREWVYQLRNAPGRTMRLKLAALASLILLCLICAGCPDESQQQSSRISHGAHPGAVAVAEYSSAPSELGCAGAAILAAFLCKRKKTGNAPNGLP
jgi:hypothetical protein